MQTPAENTLFIRLPRTNVSFNFGVGEAKNIGYTEGVSVSGWSKLSDSDSTVAMPLFFAWWNTAGESKGKKLWT